MSYLWMKFQEPDSTGSSVHELLHVDLQKDKYAKYAWGNHWTHVFKKLKMFDRFV
jgi:hypothetical protein